MPIGTTCRVCGAPLPPDLGWCARCYTPVTAFAARPPLHDPGTYVGMPRADVRTSRWRGSATTLGPVGRLALTAALLLIFPWWAVVLPLRSVWRRTRVPAGAAPTALDRLAERHPFLGRRLALPPWAKAAVVVAGAAGAVAIWLSMNSVHRLLWIGLIVVTVGALVLAKEHDL
jgi:hypothetical protein